MANQGSGGNVIAALCNVFIPGLGHLVQGRLLAAFLFFVIIGICYWSWVLVVPGVIAVVMHVWCIIDAAKYDGS